MIAKCSGEYIHPYGRGFIFYTDKPWVEGEIDLDDKKIQICGIETIYIPLISVLSVDKKIALPALKEGRSSLLIEYLNIRTKERIYTLFSGEGPCIREFKIALLKRLVSNVLISYKIEDRWGKGYLRVENDFIKIIPGNYAVHLSKIDDISRRTMEIGFNRVALIRIDIGDKENQKSVYILAPPLKRDFFWQLLKISMEDYINREILMKLSNREKLILQMLYQGWTYEQIQARLEIPENEMSNILRKLESMGIIKKVIIVNLTQRGKSVMDYLPQEDFE